LAPHSGCLTEKEAKFCNMAHYGEWEPNILTSMIGKMSSNNRKKFLEAKEKFKLYIEVNENCL